VIRISSVWNAPLADEQDVPLLEGVARCVCIWGTSSPNRGIIVMNTIEIDLSAEPRRQWLVLGFVLATSVAGTSVGSYDDRLCAITSLVTRRRATKCHVTLGGHFCGCVTGTRQ